MRIETLRGIAERFWVAIDESPQCIRPDGLKDFPHHSCGDASVLLGAYLVDHRFEGFKYVCGYRKYPIETNHAWLQNAQIIIDVTAGQFNDSPSKIIASENSIWHQGFSVQPPTDSDFRILNYSSELQEIYEYLVRKVAPG